MRVLVACEYSGIVRDAFIARGHDAMSCDLLPTEKPGPHFQGPVERILDGCWDLMIAHPPCTYLASSGLHWNKRDPARVEKTEDALRFIQLLLDAPIPRIVLENPVGCISTRIRKPDQVIQPWWFGHPEAKRTCLWLKGVDILMSTNLLPPPECGYWENQTPLRQNKLGNSKTRQALRSRTYEGIAHAMSQQWG